jgi:renalase
MDHDLIIVGAGVAGLSLANAMTGSSPLVLERSRGVGGRCATRRVESGIPVDHGVPMIHGRDGGLAQVLSGMDSLEPLWDWPMRLRGVGTPCQPQAYDSRTVRAAFATGVTAFAKGLSSGHEVRLNTEVTAIRPGKGCFELEAGGETLRAARVALTCPLPGTADLIRPLAADAPELAGLLKVLDRVHLLPCLTVMAGYDRPTADDWHIWVPGPDNSIHSLINDSSKRPAGAKQVLVIQGNPVFSRENLDEDPSRWSSALLKAAADVLGGWTAEPIWQQEHRWIHARVQRGDELSNPVLLSWPGGQQLALCGEAFNGAGGVEGALLSGLALAKRMTDGEPTPVSGS